MKMRDYILNENARKFDKSQICTHNNTQQNYNTENMEKVEKYGLPTGLYDVKSRSLFDAFIVHI